jgi:hypothetical protein
MNSRIRKLGIVHQSRFAHAAVVSMSRIITHPIASCNAQPIGDIYLAQKNSNPDASTRKKELQTRIFEERRTYFY